VGRGGGWQGEGGGEVKEKEGWAEGRTRSWEGGSSGRRRGGREGGREGGRKGKTRKWEGGREGGRRAGGEGGRKGGGEGVRGRKTRKPYAHPTHVFLTCPRLTRPL
jgi:hypothetical protein